ncbi:MAG: BrnT family toxin [Pseudomonadales bacterium]|jgi:uncharacterized DUF497 family protein|nr:BrnT family toxin [Pseudomonadales bacterium]
MQTIFEWDPKKAESNYKKHHVSFETAARVFLDPFAFVEQDRIENGEYRWQTTGLVDGHLLLLVVHTVQFDENDQNEEAAEVIEIISARHADPRERKRYEQNYSL